MKRVHYFSGLIITVFIGLHLLNHFISVFGAKYHIEFMNSLRFIYRNFVVETILLIAIAVQIISGLKLFFLKHKSANNYYEKLQIWTGLYLAFFLLIHVGAVLIGRYFLNLNTNFYFGVAGLNTFPLNLFFIPYYGLAIISFFGHVSAIHYRKMKNEVLGFSIGLQSKVILIIGILLTLVIFYGLTNGYSGVEIPKEYKVLIGK